MPGRDGDLHAGWFLQPGDYPRITACRQCDVYLAEHAPWSDPSSRIAAILAHHDSGHTRDVSVIASEHFA